MSARWKFKKNKPNWIYKWVLDGRGAAGALIEGISDCFRNEKILHFSKYEKTLTQA